MKISFTSATISNTIKRCYYLSLSQLENIILVWRCTSGHRAQIRFLMYIQFKSCAHFTLNHVPMCGVMLRCAFCSMNLDLTQLQILLAFCLQTTTCTSRWSDVETGVFVLTWNHVVCLLVFEKVKVPVMFSAENYVCDALRNLVPFIQF